MSDVVEGTPSKIQTDVDIMMEKLCDICAKIPWKYRCPACETQTCSLECCKEHKVSLACTGEKDPTRFKPMSEFGNLDLMADYRFLESAGRVAENSRRNEASLVQSESAAADPSGFQNRNNPFPLFRACQQRKIRLEFQPKGLERSQLNQTEYNRDANTIFWTVELVFVSVNGEICIRLHRIPESVTLKTLCSQILTEKSRKRSLVEIPKEEKECLEKFQRVHSGLDTLLCYQRIERCPAKFGQKFQEIDLNETIQANLADSMVIEFPRLYIIAPYRLNLGLQFPVATAKELEEIRKSRRYSTSTPKQDESRPEFRGSNRGRGGRSRRTSDRRKIRNRNRGKISQAPKTQQNSAAISTEDANILAEAPATVSQATVPSVIGQPMATSQSPPRIPSKPLIVRKARPLLARGKAVPMRVPLLRPHVMRGRPRLLGVHPRVMAGMRGRPLLHRGRMLMRRSMMMIGRRPTANRILNRAMFIGQRGPLALRGCPGGLRGRGLMRGIVRRPLIGQPGNAPMKRKAANAKSEKVQMTQICDSRYLKAEAEREGLAETVVNQANKEVQGSEKLKSDIDADNLDPLQMIKKNYLGMGEFSDSELMSDSD